MKNNKIAVLSGVLLIMIFFTSCTANKDNTAEISENISSEAAEISGSSDSEKPWETAYNKTLNDFYNEYNKKKFPSQPQKIYYDIYDLDGDDIPELIISEGEFHSAGCRIYSYIAPDTVYLGRAGEWGQISFFPESRLLLFAWTNQGHYIAKWYEISDHEMKLLYSYGYWWNSRDEQQYQIEEKTATEEEYNEYLEKHSDKSPPDGEEQIKLGKGTAYP